MERIPRRGRIGGASLDITVPGVWLSSGAHLTLRGEGVEVGIVLFGANQFTVIKRG